MRRLPAALLSALLAAGPALAVDTTTTPSGLINTARSQIAAGNYDAAIVTLGDVIAQQPQNADALNLLGYASRKAGRLEVAARWYAQALAADPAHLGALEYQGELFLMLGDRAAAEANLARLTELCGACEEREELAAAIAALGS